MPRASVLLLLYDAADSDATLVPQLVPLWLLLLRDMPTHGDAEPKNNSTVQ
jgi:hypothetical protein